VSDKRKGRPRGAGLPRSVAVAFAVSFAALCVIALLIQQGTVPEKSMAALSCCAVFIGSLAGSILAAGGRRKGAAILLPSGALAAAVLLGRLFMSAATDRASLPLAPLLCAMTPGILMLLLRRRRRRV
jgi:hypothetical protein